ncbi:MAG: PPA1309 family protein [Nocardioides sp.]
MSGSLIDEQASLEATVAEIEAHVAASGWDQPPRLYALVPTADLLEREPGLAGALGLSPGDARPAGLTPVEQEPEPGRALEDQLTEISWPSGVAGCVAALERVMLPPEAEVGLPTDSREAASYAARHPLRAEVRLVVGVTRGGAAYCAVRVRDPGGDSGGDSAGMSAEDGADGQDGASVMVGPELVPGLVELLRLTFEEDTRE